MPRGGLRNPKGGRPLGARDRLPRASKDDDRIKQFVAEVENAEFFVTDPQTKVYKGNSRELMVDIYKAEQVPLKYRMYAAAKMIEYEAVRDEIAGVPRPKTDVGEALVAAILRLKFDEDEPREGEVIPPALPKPRVRRGTMPNVTDAQPVAESAVSDAKSTGCDEEAPSIPEPFHEITPEEQAVLAATQHLRHLRRN